MDLASRENHQWTQWSTDLTLTRGEHLKLTLPEQKVYHSTRLSEASTLMPKSRLCDRFFEVVNEKLNPCPGHLT